MEVEDEELFRLDIGSPYALRIVIRSGLLGIRAAIRGASRRNDSDPCWLVTGFGILRAVGDGEL